MKTKSPARTAGEYAPTGFGMSAGSDAGCQERLGEEVALAIVHAREEEGRIMVGISEKHIPAATPSVP